MDGIVDTMERRMRTLIDTVRRHAGSLAALQGLEEGARAGEDKETEADGDPVELRGTPLELRVVRLHETLLELEGGVAALTPAVDDTHALLTSVKRDHFARRFCFLLGHTQNIELWDEALASQVAEVSSGVPEFEVYLSRRECNRSVLHTSVTLWEYEAWVDALHPVYIDSTIARLVPVKMDDHATWRSWRAARDGCALEPLPVDFRKVIVAHFPPRAAS